MTETPNVVLVVLDTVRQKTLERAETPTLDALANDGVEFTRAIAPAPWTPPSHAAMFTGLYTAEHGVDSATQQFDPPVDPLPVAFSDAGYRTVALSNNPYVSPEFGYDVWFDTFVDNNRMLYQDALDLNGLNLTTYTSVLRAALGHQKPFLSLLNAVHHKVGVTDDGAATTLRKFGREVRDGRSPMFAFMNLMEAHAKYWPPSEYRRQALPEDVSMDEAEALTQFHWEYILDETVRSDRNVKILRSLYRAAVEYLDDVLGSLVETLRDAGEWQNTALIVVGDHGENLGENGLFGHVGDVSESLLRVPFVFHHDDVTDTVDAPVSLRAVSDLSRALLDGTVETALSDLHENAYAISEYTGFHNADEIEARYGADLERFTQTRQVVYHGEYKYVRNESESNVLLDLRVPAADRSNRIGDEPSVAETCREILDGEVGGVDTYDLSRQPTDVTDETRSRLRELGYVVDE